LTFGLVYNGGLSSGISTPGFLKSFFPAPGLGLRVESQGDRLLLSWNRHHPAVRNSKGGLLQIDDGPKRRQIILDSAQILNGSVLYRPTSDDVTFRLEVEGMRDGKVSESMRVLEAAGPGTLDVSAPQAATAVPSASRPAMPLGQPNSGTAGRTTAVQIPNASTQTSATDIARRSSGTAADGPVVNAPPVTRSSTLVGETQPAPPPHTPLDVPIKKAEAQGQVHFDVLPGTPAAAGNGEPGAAAHSGVTPSPIVNSGETTRSASSPEIHAAPAPVIAKQNPEKPNLERSGSEKQNPLPVPSSAPSLNAAAPKAPPTPNYRAPRPLRQVLPNTSLLSPGILAGAGRVEVILKVDATGHVTEAHIASGAKKVSPLIAGTSLLAAKQWVFEPATLNGRPVPSEHSVVFQFQAPK
jgi:hypothetical protein